MPFRRIKRNYSIQKIDYYNDNYSVEKLANKIKSLEVQINESNQAILQAQVVRIRSMFSRETNLLAGLQRSLVESQTSNSINWHIKNLYTLKEEKRNAQRKLDILTGQVWQKRIKNLISWLFIILSVFISIVILIMGIFAAIYSLPFLITLLIGFYIFNRLKK